MIDDIDVVYLIATQERTGSNLLADALRRTGVAGDPDEWFGFSQMHGFMIGCGVAAPSSTPDRPVPYSIPAYMEAMCRRTATFGISGLKLHWYQVERLRATGLVADPIDLFGPRPVRIVRLTRRDRERQAISVVRAHETGIYVRDARSAPGIVRHRRPYWWRNGQTVSGSAVQEIDAVLETIDAHDRAWAAWIRTNEFAPLDLVYEDVAADPVGTAATVLAYLGRSWTPRPLSIALQKQADETSERILAQYRARKLQDAAIASAIRGGTRE